MSEIFINTSSLLAPRTGIGNYTFHIASRLLTAQDIKITFFDGHYTSKLPKATQQMAEGRQSKLLTALKQFPSVYNLLKRLHNTMLARTLKNRVFDLYFEPAFLPLSVSARHLVITVHDFSFHLHRDWHPEERVMYFEKYFWNEVKKADHLIFVSNFIRKSAIEEFGMNAARCTTIYCGVDHNIFRPQNAQELQVIRQRYNLSEPFILFTGSVEPRKNLQNLIKAYLSLPASVRKDVKLLLAGFSGWRNKEIMHTIQAYSQDIRYMGYVPEKDLAGLYNLAEVFVYPSFYEGFGLPPLEAMACGAAVIVSNTTSMPEVCGNAALYVNPSNADQIASAILDLLQDSAKREALSAAGKRRAALFSWDKAAQAHLTLFKQVMNGD